jgi:hypothetical protein
MWSKDPYPDELFDPEQQHTVSGTLVVPAGVMSDFCVHYVLSTDEEPALEEEEK